ncbi:MAG: tyrosine-type recombinase/integrase [Oscillospiraceae bacterium]|nr:tyrosine-type recombinase/integrase [Oscillospiraceae bacterium]
MLAKYLRKKSFIKSNYVFVTSKGEPIKLSTISQLFKKLKVRAEIPRLHAHLLRHTFATKFLENGGDIYTLQQILGHTTLEMVKRYVHITPKAKARKYALHSPLDNM